MIIQRFSQNNYDKYISNVLLYSSEIRANVILHLNRLILISNIYSLKKKKQRTINKLK